MASAKAKTKTTTVVEGVEVTLSLDEATALLVYLDLLDMGACQFRCDNPFMYGLQNEIKAALKA